MRLINLTAILAVMMLVHPVSAQTPTQGPQFHLATCTGANNTQVCRVPVYTINSTGGTTVFWWTVTYTFVSNNAGDLFNAMTPILTKAPDVPGTGGGGTGGGTGTTGTYKTGLWRQEPSPNGRADNQAYFILTGSGSNLAMTPAPGSNCGYPLSMTWYPGVTIDNHPLKARLLAAGITQTSGVSFGIGGGVDTCIGQPTGFRQYFRPNSILRFSLVDQDTLKVESHTDANDDDNDKKDDQATPGAFVLFKFISTSTVLPTTP